MTDHRVPQPDGAAGQPAAQADDAEAVEAAFRRMRDEADAYADGGVESYMSPALAWEFILISFVGLVFIALTAWVVRQWW